MPEITRFAPSPTGLLHLGHAYSALFAARAAGPGGRFLLRIEDIDPLRCQPAFTDALLEDLAWLGLRWEEPVRLQSRHLDDYAAALDRLRGMGLVYPCFCTRKDIQREVGDIHRAPHGPDGAPLYPGTCRSLPAEEATAREAAEPHALRLDVARALALAGAPLTWHDRARGAQVARPEMFGDVVLARKDTPTSYHLAVTVDDALQGVTLVTRGHDLFEATHIHRLLQALLGLPTPDYHHHGLLTGPDGKRYAKRDQSLTLRALRESGMSVGEVMAMLGETGI
ncbi:tRNA glutamyl-Q(34) synthetase GluQRS [Novispirillum sp. DQ9]|uniref:tRNA glutamyl-Q(34) synthetase GluQRS n=1 Tax=Novispirillum sp. DQ9 TaxID=3398612 RepID=UPI003C7D0BBB